MKRITRESMPDEDGTSIVPKQTWHYLLGAAGKALLW